MLEITFVRCKIFILGVKGFALHINQFSLSENHHCYQTLSPDSQESVKKHNFLLTQFNLPVIVPHCERMASEAVVNGF